MSAASRTVQPATQARIQARKVADELRVIRKALRRIEAHPAHETLPALERVRQMVAEATSKRRQ